MILRKLNSGYLFLLSFLAVFVVTPIFQKGVFGDGLMYLTVAFSRYKGYGSFWKQHYTNTSMSFFCEQPPLYFEALNGFYKLFGGAEIAEKFFTIFLLVLTVILSIGIWNKLTGGKRKNIAWLPSLLTLCVPIFTWAFCNQVIETMVVPLSLFVFYLQLIYVQSKNLNIKLLAFCGMIALLFLLFLTKGIQSVFLLAGLFFAAVTIWRTQWLRTSLSGLLLIAGCLGIGGIVFLTNEEAQFWLKSYFEKRIIATFNHTGATAAHHIDIIIRFFSELLPVLGFFILVSVWLKISKGYSLSLQWKNFRSNQKALWLILISLSASLPLAVTLEQRGFYLSPAFPFVILGLCLFYNRFLFVLFARLFAKREKIFSSLGALFLAGAIAFFIMNRDGFKRDEGMIKDVAQIKKAVKKGEMIGINPSTWNIFSLHSYLSKENDNSLSVTDTLEYFMQERSNTESVPAHYKRVNITTEDIDLYRRELPVK